jgi:hypothetical protein
MSSLEDVFIKIAKDAEEQAAGEKTIQIKSPSGLECDIKIGNEEVQTAGNERFKVVWGIDDNGQLSALETIPVAASPAVSTESAQASLGFVSAPTEAQGAEEIQSVGRLNTLFPAISPWPFLLLGCSAVQVVSFHSKHPRRLPIHTKLW